MCGSSIGSAPRASAATARRVNPAPAPAPVPPDWEPERPRLGEEGEPWPKPWLSDDPPLPLSGEPVSEGPLPEPDPDPAPPLAPPPLAPLGVPWEALELLSAPTSRCTSLSWKSRSVTPLVKRISAARLSRAPPAPASRYSKVRMSDAGLLPVHKTRRQSNCPYDNEKKLTAAEARDVKWHAAGAVWRRAAPQHPGRDLLRGNLHVTKHAAEV